MDLPGLRTVVAVADELHFGRAAQRLGIAQPQVSQRVRKLEDELGLVLFDRDNQGVAVTAAGVHVVRHAREVVRSADGLTRLADGLREGSRGTVRIGAVGSAFFGALSELLAPARQAMPDVELQVREMESPQQLEALAAGTIDLGLLRPPAPRDLLVRHVWSEPLVVALPSGSDLARAGSLSRADLTGQPVVLFSRSAGPGYWDRATALLAHPGTDLQPAAEADHVTTLLGLVSLGVGLTLVPASTQVLQLPGVTYLPLTEQVPLLLSLATVRQDLSPAAALVAASIPSLLPTDADR
jgi:DNA-binding transcriptional LysR family regulator